MKLTKSRLSRIIIEELNRQINEGGPSVASLKRSVDSVFEREIDNDKSLSAADAARIKADYREQKENHMEYRIRLTDQEFVELGGEAESRGAYRFPSSEAQKSPIGKLSPLAGERFTVYYDFDPQPDGDGIPKYDRKQVLVLRPSWGAAPIWLTGVAGLKEIVRWSEPESGPKEQGKAEMALKSLSPVHRATPEQRKAAKEREKDVTKAGVYDQNDIQKRLEQEKEKRGARLYDLEQEKRRKASQKDFEKRQAASEEEFKKRQAASQEKPSLLRRFKGMFGLEELKRIVREEIEKEIRESKLR